MTRKIACDDCYSLINILESRFLKKVGGGREDKLRSWLVTSLTTAFYSRASTFSALSNTPRPHHSNPPRNPVRDHAHHSSTVHSSYRDRDRDRHDHSSRRHPPAAQAFRYASKSRPRLRPAQEAKAKKLVEVTPSLICDVSCGRQQQNSTTRSRPSRLDPGRLARMKTRQG